MAPQPSTPSRPTNPPVKIQVSSAPRPSSNVDEIRREFFKISQQQLRLQRKALQTQSRELALYNQQIQEQNQYYTQQLGLTQQQVMASEARAQQYQKQLDLLVATEQRQQTQAAQQAQFADATFNVERQRLGTNQLVASRNAMARRGMAQSRPRITRSVGMVRNG